MEQQQLVWVFDVARNHFRSNKKGKLQRAQLTITAWPRHLKKYMINSIIFYNILEYM